MFLRRCNKIGELEELEKLRTDGIIGGDNDESEKDATIRRMQNKLSQTESELAEVTELKNAEIDVLRKQLNRAEHKQTDRDVLLQETEDAKDKSWGKEREGLREEIRRLNLEVSTLNEKVRLRSSLEEEEEEENDLTSRYRDSNNGRGGKAGQYSENLDNNDVASLESIISMMRQTIDQCNKEKDLLEQRLTEEQERSQMELKAFAKTLEGVDDLRTSAEAMSREIRRIKVKGYRPTRSELMGGGEGGTRHFGELTAAVEASESMEEAIRLIESQNDSMEERRRMGVVVASSTATTMTTTTPSLAPSVQNNGSLRVFGRGLMSTIPDDDREGGFLSFWSNNKNSNNDNDGIEDATKNKDERSRKKKSRRKKSKDAGSVITSFF